MSECEHANFILNLNHIFENLSDISNSDADTPDTRLSFHNLIQNNTKILHTLKYTNSNLLLFLEALYIKYRKPLLSNGIKASKDLAVFSQASLFADSIVLHYYYVISSCLFVCSMIASLLIVYSGLTMTLK